MYKFRHKSCASKQNFYVPKKIKISCASKHNFYLSKKTTSSPSTQFQMGKWDKQKNFLQT